MGQLNGKVAIVVGGTRGLGYQISTTFAREGASVVVVGRDAERAQRSVSEIEALGSKAIAVLGDIGEQSFREKVAEEAVKAFGTIDIVVNSTGYVCKTSFLDTDIESFDRSVELHMKAAYFMSQLACRQMIKDGHGGRIINIGSTASLQGERNATVYGGVKGAMVSFTKAIALEMGEYGITANCVMPGFTETRDNGVIAETRSQIFIPITPTRTINKAQDVADLCLFLASDNAKQITAQALAVDGGYSGTRMF